MYVLKKSPWLFVLFVLFGLSACTGYQSATPTAGGHTFDANATCPADDTKCLSGKLEIFVAEDFVSEPQYSYQLKTADNRTYDVNLLGNDLELKSGSQVVLKGKTGSSMIDVDNVVSKGNVIVTQNALSSADSVKEIRVAVILVKFQDKPNDGAHLSQSEMAKYFFSDSKSVSNYMREASYGKVRLTADIYGPYIFSRTSTSCQETRISNFGLKAAQDQVGVAKMATYTHFAYFFPGGGCSWAGLAILGGNTTWYNGHPNDGGVIGHELGHNLGLNHSHSKICWPYTLHASSCATAEYGNGFDVMGDSRSWGHFNSAQKYSLGWLSESDSSLVTAASSGTYTLSPLETPGGTKALRIKSSVNDWIYFEYRQAIGFDATILTGNSNITSGLLGHHALGSHTYLLDMRPDVKDMGRPAMPVGKSYTDPFSGIKVTLKWANATNAGVEVVVGGDSSEQPPSCVRGNPIVTVSPAQQQGYAGTALTYSVSIKNTDSSACSSSNYTLSASGVAAGWQSSFAAPTTPLAPGATSSASLKVTSPVTAAANNYLISVRAQNTAETNYLGSASLTYALVEKVTTPPPTTPPPAPITGGTGQYNFNQSNSTTLGGGWVVPQGSFSIESNRAVHRGATALAIAPNSSSSTQAVTVKMQRTHTVGAARLCVVLRYQDLNNYYALCVNQGGSALGGIYRVVKGTFVLLKQTGNIQNLYTERTIKASAAGTTLTLQIDNHPAITAVDATYATGMAGFYVTKSSSPQGEYIDDFSLAK